MKEKVLLLNLISVFVVGFALTTFLHEIAHAIIAKMVGVKPELFHSYVSYNDSSTSAIRLKDLILSSDRNSSLENIFLKKITDPYH